MTTVHWFWTIVSILVVLWYIVVTIIVTYKGGSDVFELFRELDEEHPDS